MGAEFDLVIRGGTIVDGTGGAVFEGDVAIRGGRIAEVGRKVTGAGAEEVEAKGLTVTPGFVDIHTHYDGQATWDSVMSPSFATGITSAIFGTRRVGFAPARPHRHDWLVNLMEGVEQIAATALREGMTWGRKSFPEYLDALAS